MSIINRTHGRRRLAGGSIESPAGAKAPTAAGPSGYLRWKGILDRALAAILLVPCVPIIGILVLIVRVTSPGPGIYCQRRVGKNGRPFILYKIRTMEKDAEKETGPVWSQVKDPRVTFLGRILRMFHLDELPQLVNVLKGEMSFVGPRPERPEFVRVLSAAIPGYPERLAAVPGVTGLAQLNLPPDTDLRSVRRKWTLDMEYIRRAGFWLDVRLLLCTFLRVFKIPALGILGLRRSVPGFENEPALPASGNGDGLARMTPEAVVRHLASLRQAHASHPGGNGHDDNGHDDNGHDGNGHDGNGHDGNGSERGLLSRVRSRSRRRPR